MAHGPAIWLPFVQPFATLVIGLAASALAYRQWLTANERLKLDLYEKRSMFLDESTKEYIEIFRDGQQAQDNLIRLYYSLSKMETVFQGSACDLISEIKPNVNYLIGRRAGPDSSEKADKAFNAIVELMPKIQDTASEQMAIRIPSLLGTWR